MSYYIATTVACDFDAAIERVTEALAGMGFGILTEIDVEATLAKKLGVEFRPYRILGACNPELAHRALGSEPMIGVMLPCNVIVQEREGAVEVAAIDPEQAMQGVDNPELGAVAREVRRRLQVVIDSL